MPWPPNTTHQFHGLRGSSPANRTLGLGKTFWSRGEWVSRSGWGGWYTVSRHLAGITSSTLAVICVGFLLDYFQLDFRSIQKMQGSWKVTFILLKRDQSFASTVSSKLKD